MSRIWRTVVLGMLVLSIPALADVHYDTVQTGRNLNQVQARLEALSPKPDSAVIRFQTYSDVGQFSVNSVVHKNLVFERANPHVDSVLSFDGTLFSVRNHGAKLLLRGLAFRPENTSAVLIDGGDAANPNRDLELDSCILFSPQLSSSSILISWSGQGDNTIAIRRSLLVSEGGSATLNLLADRIFLQNNVFNLALNLNLTFSDTASLSQNVFNKSKISLVNAPGGRENPSLKGNHFHNPIAANSELTIFSGFAGYTGIDAANNAKGTSAPWSLPSGVFSTSKGNQDLPPGFFGNAGPWNYQLPNAEGRGILYGDHKRPAAFNFWPGDSEFATRVGSDSLIVHAAATSFPRTVTASASGEAYTYGITEDKLLKPLFPTEATLSILGLERITSLELPERQPQGRALLLAKAPGASWLAQPAAQDSGGRSFPSQLSPATSFLPTYRGNTARGNAVEVAFSPDVLTFRQVDAAGVTALQRTSLSPPPQHRDLKLSFAYETDASVTDSVEVALSATGALTPYMGGAVMWSVGNKLFAASKSGATWHGVLPAEAMLEAALVEVLNVKPSSQTQTIETGLATIEILAEGGGQLLLDSSSALDNRRSGFHRLDDFSHSMKLTWRGPANPGSLKLVFKDTERTLWRWKPGAPSPTPNSDWTATIHQLDTAEYFFLAIEYDLPWGDDLAASSDGVRASGMKSSSPGEIRFPSAPELASLDTTAKRVLNSRGVEVAHLQLQGAFSLELDIAEPYLVDSVVAWVQTSGSWFKADSFEVSGSNVTIVVPADVQAVAVLENLGAPAPFGILSFPGGKLSYISAKGFQLRIEEASLPDTSALPGLYGFGKPYRVEWAGRGPSDSVRISLLRQAETQLIRIHSSSINGIGFSTPDYHLSQDTLSVPLLPEQNGNLVFLASLRNIQASRSYSLYELQEGILIDGLTSLTAGTLEMLRLNHLPPQAEADSDKTLLEGRRLIRNNLQLQGSFRILLPISSDKEPLDLFAYLRRSGEWKPHPLEPLATVDGVTYAIIPVDDQVEAFALTEGLPIERGARGYVLSPNLSLDFPKGGSRPYDFVLSEEDSALARLERNWPGIQWVVTPMRLYVPNLATADSAFWVYAGSPGAVALHVADGQLWTPAQKPGDSIKVLLPPEGITLGLARGSLADTAKSYRISDRATLVLKENNSARTWAMLELQLPPNSPSHGLAGGMAWVASDTNALAEHPGYLSVGVSLDSLEEGFNWMGSVVSPGVPAGISVPLLQYDGDLLLPVKTPGVYRITLEEATWTRSLPDASGPAFAGAWAASNDLLRTTSKGFGPFDDAREFLAKDTLETEGVANTFLRRDGVPRSGHGIPWTPDRNLVLALPTQEWVPVLEMPAPTWRGTALVAGRAHELIAHRDSLWKLPLSDLQPGIHTLAVTDAQGKKVGTDAEILIAAEPPSMKADFLGKFSSGDSLLEGTLSMKLEMRDTVVGLAPATLRIVSGGRNLDAFVLWSLDSILSQNGVVSTIIVSLDLDLRGYQPYGGEVEVVLEAAGNTGLTARRSFVAQVGSSKAYQVTTSSRDSLVDGNLTLSQKLEGADKGAFESIDWTVACLDATGARTSIEKTLAVEQDFHEKIPSGRICSYRYVANATGGNVGAAWKPLKQTRLPVADIPDDRLTYPAHRWHVLRLAEAGMRQDLRSHFGAEGGKGLNYLILKLKHNGQYDSTKAPEEFLWRGDSVAFLFASQELHLDGHLGDSISAELLPRDITLQKGWNMVANPFPIPLRRYMLVRGKATQEPQALEEIITGTSSDSASPTYAWSPFWDSIPAFSGFAIYSDSIHSLHLDPFRTEVSLKPDLAKRASRSDGLTRVLISSRGRQAFAAWTDESRFSGTYRMRAPLEKLSVSLGEGERYLLKPAALGSSHQDQIHLHLAESGAVRLSVEDAEWESIRLVELQTGAVWDPNAKTTGKDEKVFSAGSHRLRLFAGTEEHVTAATERFLETAFAQAHLRVFTDGPGTWRLRYFVPYGIGTARKMSLGIHDLAGRHLGRFELEPIQGRQAEQLLSLKDLSRGLYLIRLDVLTDTRRLSISEKLVGR